MAILKVRDQAAFEVSESPDQIINEMVKCDEKQGRLILLSGLWIRISSIDIISPLPVRDENGRPKIYPQIK